MRYGQVENLFTEKNYQSERLIIALAVGGSSTAMLFLKFARRGKGLSVESVYEPTHSLRNRPESSIDVTGSDALVVLDFKPHFAEFFVRWH